VVAACRRRGGCCNGDIGSLAGAGRMQTPSRLATWNGFHIAASLDDPLAMCVGDVVKPAAGAVTGATRSARPTPRTFENVMDNYYAPMGGRRTYATVVA
jgi:hypothetical protein